MVALLLMLSACGSQVDVGSDASADAQPQDADAVDVGSADADGDAGGADAGDHDAGWCVSSPCTQRLRLDADCIENPKTGFACDAGPGFHDGECNAVDQCVGEPCECTAGPCCDGCFFFDVNALCDLPADEGITVCDGAVAQWDLIYRQCDPGGVCSPRQVVSGTGSSPCPQGTYCDSSSERGMRCRPI